MQTTRITEKIYALFSSYFPLEKQLLVCYWAFATEIEFLATGHQVNKRPERPIIN